MAHVKNVGARMFLPPDLTLPDDPPQTTTPIGWQLFADLSLGPRVMTNRPGSLSIPHGHLPASVDEFAERFIWGTSRVDAMAEDTRAITWGQLAEEIERTWRVKTDAETLMRLPFVAEASDEVHALLEAR